MFKKILRKLVSIIQKVLITLLLTLLYFIGFGLTALILTVIKKTRPRTGGVADHSSWCDAQGYEPHLDEALRQS